ncbi:MAG: four helix bundle protein [Roseburia sp.]|nr:four helix bundle protein [Roseburia sp.]
MRENKLADLSMEFSIKVIDMTENIKGHSALVNQLERSATSIGANIHEANYAQSKADFISKLQIALKECYETEYWLELFVGVHLANATIVKDLKNACGTIRRLLIASINTAKSST